MQSPVESFRMSFWWVTGYVVAAMTVTAVPLILVIDMIEGRMLLPKVDLVQVVVLIAVVEVFGFLHVFALIMYFKVYVSPDGLRAPFFWWGYGESTWADIRSARPVNILGFKSLRVFTAEANAPLWLPLFLSDLEGFYQLVRQYAGPEHPLAVALHNELA